MDTGTRKASSVGRRAFAKVIIIIFFLRWYFVSSFFGIQHCCSQLRRKEMLDDVEDDIWWKPNFAQHHSASWNIVQHGSQTSATLVSVGSATMLGDVASVWPGIKDTNGGSENKNCSVCTLKTYNAELILWSTIFILFCQINREGINLSL